MRTALRKILYEWCLCLLTFGPPCFGLTKFDVPLVYISNSNFYYNNSFKWILAQSLNEILLKNLQGAHITTQISSHAVIVHSVVLIFKFRRFFRAPELCLDIPVHREADKPFHQLNTSSSQDKQINIWGSIH